MYCHKKEKPAWSSFAVLVVCLVNYGECHDGACLAWVGLVFGLVFGVGQAAKLKKKISFCLFGG